MLIWPALVSLLLTNVVGDETDGVISTSANPSGVKCGFNPPLRCLSKSSCSLLKTCQCPSGTYGEGAFACYPTNIVRAEISGSPNKLKTFNNTSSGLYWPCRFRFTEFTTDRKSNKQKCHFQVFGSNQILGGRIALTGIEVHLQLINGSSITRGIGIRKSGKVQSGIFKYTEWGKYEFVKESPVTYVNIEDSGTGGSGSGDGVIVDDEDSGENAWGPPEQLDLGDGQRVTCSVDQDNFATISVPDCSTTIQFRAPNVDLSQQTHIPGLSVAINKDSGQTQFISPFTYLAETPSESILGSIAILKNLRSELEVLNRAMEYAAKQYSTPEGDECEDTAFIYRSYCDTELKKTTALNACFYYLEDPKLISCMDPPEGNAFSNGLNAFKLCVWHNCRPNQSVCKLLKSLVQDAGCLPLILPGFANDCRA